MSTNIMLKKRNLYETESEDRRMFENNKGVIRDSDNSKELDSWEIEMMGRLAAET